MTSKKEQERAYNSAQSDVKSLCDPSFWSAENADHHDITENMVSHGNGRRNANKRGKCRFWWFIIFRCSSAAVHRVEWYIIGTPISCSIQWATNWVSTINNKRFTVIWNNSSISMCICDSAGATSYSQALLHAQTTKGDGWWVFLERFFYVTSRSRVRKPLQTDFHQKYAARTSLLSPDDETMVPTHPSKSSSPADD